MTFTNTFPSSGCILTFIVFCKAFLFSTLAFQGKGLCGMFLQTHHKLAQKTVDQQQLFWRENSERRGFDAQRKSPVEL